MDCLNALTKDIGYTYNTKDGGAIKDEITSYFAEYLLHNGQTNLSTSSNITYCLRR